MLKNLSTKAKILAGVSIVAAICAIAVLVIILVGGKDDADSLPVDNPNGPTEVINNDIKNAVKNLPDPDALTFVLSELKGYWVSDQKFVGFDSQSMEYGLLQSGYGVMGQITESGVQGENSFFIEMFIPARPATEMDDAIPARGERILVDISNYDDGRINIKVEGLDNGEWRTYEFGGRTLEEVY